mmetsp:Transcript_23914/g.60483  ORF Transcript_23914/g.60483 Transcript_23914/m.60483 type:complete len:403 (-) Transcript_23914:143-1351(-)|eukprot:CAMPEP_0113884752 /NCGR_PEP_ID=MMETSP0780_2-20120614/10469_1 /TAXON_ID=652834 /ORGANISM="Palpitomonas bilix" /LENGTH=402 /DNA_ID=CAMNT_0000872481 /DNA_START=303 /DNA_END=1511 /DNA_ORIENTATION=- /assembly_acc=CAM_ASM_000599
MSAENASSILPVPLSLLPPASVQDVQNGRGTNKGERGNKGVDKTPSLANNGGQKQSEGSRTRKRSLDDDDRPLSESKKRNTERGGKGGKNRSQSAELSGPSYMSHSFFGHEGTTDSSLFPALMENGQREREGDERTWGRERAKSPLSNQPNPFFEGLGGGFQSESSFFGQASVGPGLAFEDAWEKSKQAFLSSSLALSRTADTEGVVAAGRSKGSEAKSSKKAKRAEKARPAPVESPRPPIAPLGVLDIQLSAAKLAHLLNDNPHCLKSNGVKPMMDLAFAIAVEYLATQIEGKETSVTIVDSNSLLEYGKARIEALPSKVIHFAVRQRNRVDSQPMKKWFRFSLKKRLPTLLSIESYKDRMERHFRVHVGCCRSVTISLLSQEEKLVREFFLSKLGRASKK